jgi:hypothetical protein
MSGSQKILISALLLICPLLLCAQQLENYLHLGGTANERSNHVIFDLAGNYYLTGFYQGTVDFDPSGNTHNQTSNGSGDIFLAKYNHLGNYQWAISMGSAEFDEGKAIALDDLGNVYLTGRFRQTVDFDPSVNTTNLTSNGDADGFVAKYNNNGDLQWVFQLGGAGAEEPFDINIKNGQIVVGGQFQQSVNFDPPGGSMILTSAGAADIFAAAYNENGDYQWAIRIGNTGSESCYGIDTDASGNTYMTGFFSGTVDFDPGTGTDNYSATGNADAYLCKLDNAGVYQWAIPLGGSGFLSNDGRDLTVDGSGNITLTGRFVGTVDFDPSPNSASLTASGLTSGFLAQYDANGNYQWAFKLSSTTFGSSTLPHGIVTDQVGDIYVCGGLSGTVDFDPGFSIENRTSAGGTDIFVAKYSQAGNYLWAINSGGTLGDEALGLSANIDQVFLTGYFQNSFDVDPGTNTTTVTSNGGTDMIMSQLINTTLPVEWAGFEAQQQPNGIQLEWMTYNEFHNHHFTVQRSIDGVLYSDIGQLMSLGNASQGHFYSFLDRHPYQELNYYRIKQTDLDGNFSYSPTISIREGKGRWNWQFFPNPVTEFLTYEFSGRVGEMAEIKIINGAGGLVWRLAGVSPGSGLVAVADWSPGIYYVMIEGSGEQTFVQEIVVGGE